jgi:hypothetical protein
MQLLMSPPNLLKGITLTDIEEEIPEQRSKVRECSVSEFLEELPAETVTSKEMIGAKATKSGWLSLLDISIALGGVPPEVQGGSDEARHKAKQERKWDAFKDGRRHGFMGPIFNGGRKGWSRGTRYLLSGLGLMFAPARGVYEIVHFSTSLLSVFIKFITPNFITKPFNRRWRKVAKSLWTNIGVKIRRIWRRWQGPWAWRGFWNAAPELYRYYFPYVDAEHIRPEAEALRRALKIAKLEAKSFTDRISELEKQITDGNEGNYGPQGIFNGLADKCVSATFQGYKYEVCPFKRASQNGHITLGNWNGFGDFRKDDKIPLEGTVPNEESNSKFSMYLDWWFTGGQACHTGTKRKALVHLVCGPEDVLEEVIEPEVCLYEMKMRTPVACDPKDLDKEYDMVEEACWNRETVRCDSGRL